MYLRSLDWRTMSYGAEFPFMIAIGRELVNARFRYLQEYEWPGNLDQLNSVCERLVLLTQKRNIDEVFLRQQLEQIAPRTLPGTEQIVLYKDQKAVEIAALLKKHHGNRQQVAAELGVSKTTLWRYLKKYGIDPDYHC